MVCPCGNRWDVNDPDPPQCLASTPLPLPIEKIFNIVTSGRGMLPKGKVVGFIEASDAKQAEQALISSGQIPERMRGHFDFIERERVL